MADIEQLVTDNFPKTEAEMLADDSFDYLQAKRNAIERAGEQAYGKQTVPDEADIPDVVARWIADRATIRLIPIAKEHYSLERYLSTSTNRGENVRRYDLLRMLDGLRKELEADCLQLWPRVEDLIGSSAAPTAVPQVSTAGTMIDPVARTLLRGIP